MKSPLLKLALVRLAAVLLTMALLPLVPIATIKMGFTSPEYLHRGVLQGSAGGATEGSVAQVYLATTRGLLGATLGRSLATGQSVGQLLRSSLNATLPILGVALAISVVLGLVLGIAASLSRLGAYALGLMTLVACIPMVAVGYLALEWSGSSTGGLIRVLVPAMVLALYPAYLAARTTRATLADLAGSENARFLRACGFSERAVLISQAPKPLFLRLLALVYPTILYGLSFCFFVETPFGIAGFGQRFLTAIQTVDYPVIIGFSICGFLGLTALELTLAVAQAACDPRLRHA